MRLRMRSLSMIALIGTALFVSAGAAAAGGKPAPPDWAPYRAMWIPGVGVDQSFGLVMRSADVGPNPGSPPQWPWSYGAIRMVRNVPATVGDLNSVSFWFKGARLCEDLCGGSPRLTIVTDSGKIIFMYVPDDVTTSFQQVTEASGVWDGDCGGYGASLGDVKASCGDEQIRSLYIVNDSGWLFPGEVLTVILDEIEVNGYTASGPDGLE